MPMPPRSAEVSAESAWRAAVERSKLLTEALIVAEAHALDLEDQLARALAKLDEGRGRFRLAEGEGDQENDVCDPDCVHTSCRIWRNERGDDATGHPE